MTQLQAGTVALDVDLGSPAVARAALEGGLREAGCEPILVRDTLVVVSELVMNACVHGEGDETGQVHLTWEVDADCTVTVSVSDSGRLGTPHLEQPEQGEGGGRGLVLVEALCDSWSAASDDDGTTVTAVLSASGGSRASR